MIKKLTFFFAVVIMLVLNFKTQAQPVTYAFHGGLFRYGTLNLNTGLFTSLDFYPQGSNYYPVTGDNIDTDGQLAIMSDFAFPSNYFLWEVNFITLSGDSIAPVGPLASGQTTIKGMAHNTINDTWYVVSSDDFGNVAVLYTLNITTGVLTVVGTIQNAGLPVSMAINCDGAAYIINVVFGASSNAVLNSLNLTTAAATPIGTSLGLADVSGFSQDMDFNPETGALYWAGYWSSGFFSEGGSFRLVNMNDGTSTEIGSFNQFETITGLSINGNCPVVPVELISFSASVTGNSIILNWSTATELNNSGFEIERKLPNSNWERIGFILGAGSTTENRTYSYYDDSLSLGLYSYRLKQIDFDGSFEYSKTIEVEVNNPGEYYLNQNYPNPFNPSTKITFILPQESFVTLIVYNSLGERVMTLINEVINSGKHSINFNAGNLSSGTYLVELKAENFVDVKKMNLIK